MSTASLPIGPSPAQRTPPLRNIYQTTLRNLEPVAIKLHAPAHKHAPLVVRAIIGRYKGDEAIHSALFDWLEQSVDHPRYLEVMETLFGAQFAKTRVSTPLVKHLLEVAPTPRDFDTIVAIARNAPKTPGLSDLLRKFLELGGVDLTDDVMERLVMSGVDLAPIELAVEPWLERRSGDVEMIALLPRLFARSDPGPSLSRTLARAVTGHGETDDAVFVLLSNAFRNDGHEGHQALLRFWLRHTGNLERASIFLEDLVVRQKVSPVLEGVAAFINRPNTTGHAGFLIAALFRSRGAEETLQFVMDWLRNPKNIGGAAPVLQAILTAKRVAENPEVAHLAITWLRTTGDDISAGEIALRLLDVDPSQDVVEAIVEWSVSHSAHRGVGRVLAALVRSRRVTIRAQLQIQRWLTEHGASLVSGDIVVSLLEGRRTVSGTVVSIIRKWLFEYPTHPRVAETVKVALNLQRRPPYLTTGIVEWFLQHHEGLIAGEVFYYLSISGVIKSEKRRPGIVQAACKWAELYPDRWNTLSVWIGILFALKDFSIAERAFAAYQRAPSAPAASPLIAVLVRNFFGEARFLAAARDHLIRTEVGAGHVFSALLWLDPADESTRDDAELWVARHVTDDSSAGILLELLLAGNSPNWRVVDSGIEWLKAADTRDDRRSLKRINNIRRRLTSLAQIGYGCARGKIDSIADITEKVSALDCDGGVLTYAAEWLGRNRDQAGSSAVALALAARGENEVARRGVLRWLKRHSESDDGDSNEVITTLLAHTPSDPDLRAAFQQMVKYTPNEPNLGTLLEQALPNYGMDDEFARTVERWVLFHSNEARTILDARGASVTKAIDPLAGRDIGRLDHVAGLSLFFGSERVLGMLWAMRPTCATTRSVVIEWINRHIDSTAFLEMLSTCAETCPTEFLDAVIGETIVQRDFPAHAHRGLQKALERVADPMHLRTVAEEWVNRHAEHRGASYVIEAVARTLPLGTDIPRFLMEWLLRTFNTESALRTAELLLSNSMVPHRIALALDVHLHHVLVAEFDGSLGATASKFLESLAKYSVNDEVVLRAVLDWIDRGPSCSSAPFIISEFARHFADNEVVLNELIQRAKQFGGVRGSYDAVFALVRASIAAQGTRAQLLSWMLGNFEHKAWPSLGDEIMRFCDEKPASVAEFVAVFEGYLAYVHARGATSSMVAKLRRHATLSKALQEMLAKFADQPMVRATDWEEAADMPIARRPNRLTRDQLTARKLIFGWKGQWNNTACDDVQVHRELLTRR